MCRSNIFCYFVIFVFLKSDNTKIIGLLHFIKRLVILMIVWEIILFPITYRVVYEPANLVGMMYHIFVCGTFASSWFFRALLLGMVIIYFIPRQKRIYSFLVLSILFLVWEAYKQQIINYTGLDFYFTFIPHLYAINLGALLADNPILLSFSKKIYIIFALFLYIISFLPNMCPLLRLFIPFALIPLFVGKNIENTSFCKKIRSMSILVYILHFAVIYLFGRYCSSLLGSYIIDSILYYIIILSISLMLSYIIVCVEVKIPFLRYLH